MKLTTSTEVDVESSDEEVRGPGRRRRRSSFIDDGMDESDGGQSEAGSIVIDGAEQEDEVADQEGGRESTQFGRNRLSPREADDNVSVVSMDPEPAGDELEIAEEVTVGEEAAEAARDQAVRKRSLCSPKDTESDRSDGGVVKKARRRGAGVGSDDEEIDSLDSMVPFTVNGFCQGCRCKQNVFILGPVRKRRLGEANKILMAMEGRYRVSLVRGERRSLDLEVTNHRSGNRGRT